MKSTPASHRKKEQKRSIGQQLRFILRRSTEVWVEEGPGPFLSAIVRKILIKTGLRTRVSFFPNEHLWRPPKRVFTPIDLKASPFGDPKYYDVICLPIIDWDYRFQRPQQLLTRFARQGHRIFYSSVNTNPYEEEPEGILQGMRNMGERIWDFQFPSPEEDFDLYQEQMTPGQIEFFLASLEHLKQAAGIVDAVIKVDFPNWVPLAIQARQRFGWPVVYDCMEDHSGFSALPADLVESNEIELAQSANLVLVISEKIAERMKAHNPRVILSPNAADFMHFRYPVNTWNPFAHLKGPIIGYFGVITEWFDLDLVLETARLHPDWNFVLIGEVFSLDISMAKNLPNVFFMGEKPYQELPRFANNFDVAIIPHKRIPRTEWSGSVKLYEYLCTGRPVVATPLSWLQPLQDVVYLADTPQNFAAAIEQALQEDSPGRQAERLKFARDNSWENRTEEIRQRIGLLFPGISIIILTHNNLDVTSLCLDSIREITDYPNYEVILVDNASSDGTPEYLLAEQARDPCIRIICNEKNVGFAAGNNQGIAAAEGEYIVFLNNDTIVTSGWLSKLIRYLDNPSVGAVGPVTNMAGNESRIEVPYNTIEGIDAFARAYTRRHKGETFDIKVLNMFCVAFRREVIDQVGPLDERFGMGMFEDDDYAHRLHQAGYRLICANDVFVHHFGNLSFKQYGPDLYLHLLEENRKKFEAKWGIPWEPHQARKVS